MHSVLSIQAPSGFQAADSDVWRNGLMWGEADLDSGQLIVEPLRWNDNFSTYVFDSDAADPKFRAPGRDAFAFPLPGRDVDTATSDVITEIVEAPAAFVAQGWEIIDADALAALTAERPSAAVMSDWFDGSFPRWEVAVADGVRPRQAVDELVRRFEAAHHGAPQPMAVLLTGAGGEGKSAALLQIAAGLIRGGQDWTCLWRSASAAGLPDNLSDLLEQRDNHAWIIAIDDAENISGGLPDALRSLQPRTDVHLILAARDADWSLSGLTGAMWQGVAGFRRETLAGLDEEDAQRIAGGWVAYGDEAMGKLRGLPAERVAQSLLGHAQELAAKREEGALLGALLIAREGEDLRERVTRLMAPWKKAEGIGKKIKLLDIYAMIAAMHAENQLYLSRAVLAFALNCEEAELDRDPLRTLRREAMVDGGTTYVLTRHRRIAEVARDWLVETGYNVDRWYPFLAIAAVQHSKLTRFGPDVAEWQHGLTRHFIDRGHARWPVARSIAKALFDYDPDDAMRLTVYASTLRRTDQPGAALALLRAEGPRFPGHRGVLYEWSVAAGATGDHGLGIWLAARSLAYDRQVPFKARNIQLSLAGLGAAFRELAATTGRQGFTTAQAASGRLGLRLPDLDATARGYFEKHIQAAPPRAGAAPSIDADIATLQAAIVEASYESEPDNDPPFFEKHLGDPEGYRFAMLGRALSDTGGKTPLR